MKEATEINKIIAEFMGYRFEGDGVSKPFSMILPDENDWRVGAWSIDDFEKILEEELLFTHNWNEVHQAWKRFKNIEISGDFYDELDGYRRYIKQCISECDSPEIVAKELAEAITYYNTIKPQHPQP